MYSDEDTTDSSVIAQQPQASREQLLTQWLSAEGSNREQLLAVAAMLTNEIREAVQTETGFACSAGISHNKVCTYKYVCGITNICILCICDQPWNNQPCGHKQLPIFCLCSIIT